MAVPLLDLTRQYARIRDVVDREVFEVLTTQQFILGKKVDAFEAAFCEHIGCRHAVGMSSGTDAELAVLMALGIGPGDAVITTPYTFFATVSCLHRVGAEAVLVDIDRSTFNLDPEKLREAIESKLTRSDDGALRTVRGNRVRAIMPVHLFGLCASMDPILDLADANGLTLIEDACQASGAECRARGEVRRAGAIGPAAFFSFFPAKNLGAYGDAGIATCDSDETAERLRLVRNHGMERRYYHRMVGGNFRIDALQAAILLAKMPFIEKWNAERRANAAQYDERFRNAGLEGIIQWPDSSADPDIRNKHIFHQYVLRAPRRDALLEHLASRGIGHGVYYPVPLHLQECFAYLGYQKGDFPESEAAANESVALPIFPELREDEIAEVADAIRVFYVS